MKISHTWINEDTGRECAWALASRREIAAWKNGGGDIMEYCRPPRGWEFDPDDEDDTDDGGLPGRYLVRA
jgi:hypothetical protein